MPVTITTQPASNSLNAAYRPIIVSVSGSNPVVYCDIYFNSIFYKTISKTQAPYDFDIQNAAKEYLKKFIAPNGSTAIANASPLITSCYVKVRGSAIDPLTGFLVPEAPIPVQATDATAATSGGGSQSNTFYVLNSSLQHEDNQDLAAHLNAFKTGSWGANVYPLTHRINGYRVGKGQSDYFPIVSDSAPSGVTLHYRLRSTGQWLSTSGGTPPPSDCVAVGFAYSMPDAQAGSNYLHQAAITGSGPFTLASVVKPSWMLISVVGSNVTFSGTPPAATTGVNVSFTLNNSCGSTNFSDTIDVAASACVGVTVPSVTLPDGQANTAYSYSMSLGGTAPFSLSSIVKPAWMTVAISGSNVVFSGTPTSGATGVNISFGVSNACGSASFTDTINVTAPITVNVTGIIDFTTHTINVTLNSTLPEDVDLFIDTNVDNAGNINPKRFTVPIATGSTTGSASSLDTETITCIVANNGSNYFVSLNPASGNTYNITLTINGATC